MKQLFSLVCLRQKRTVLTLTLCSNVLNSLNGLNVLNHSIGYPFPSSRKVVWPMIAIFFCTVVLSRSATEAGHDDEYIDTIPAARIRAMLDAGEKIVFVDLRSTSDFQKSRLPGARSIPISELQTRYQEIPKSGRVILYCSCPPGGVDESYSYLSLRGKGYRNVSVLQEGFSGWLKGNFPTENR
jgi:rhodanese-related sulfurtransferase